MELDVAAAERVESELDRIIEKRAREAKDAQAIEKAWKESERRHRKRRREQNREAWRCYYLDQAERLERTAAELAAEHRARAEELAGHEGPA